MNNYDLTASDELPSLHNYESKLLDKPPSIGMGMRPDAFLFHKVPDMVIPEPQLKLVEKTDS